MVLWDPELSTRHECANSRLASQLCLWGAGIWSHSFGRAHAPVLSQECNPALHSFLVEALEKQVMALKSTCPPCPGGSLQRTNPSLLPVASCLSFVSCRSRLFPGPLNPADHALPQSHLRRVALRRPEGESSLVLLMNALGLDVVDWEKHFLSHEVFFLFCWILFFQGWFHFRAVCGWGADGREVVLSERGNDCPVLGFGCLHWQFRASLKCK